MRDARAHAAGGPTSAPSTPRCIPLVIDRMRAEGRWARAPSRTRVAGAGTWWDWKPAKLVLEDLLDQGLLMCADRTPGFARMYDLPERVLPPDLDTRDPGQLEATRHLLLRGLARLGVATAHRDGRLLPPEPADRVKPTLAGLLADGEIVPVDVEGWPAPAYSHAAALEGPLKVPDVSRRRCSRPSTT